MIVKHFFPDVAATPPLPLAILITSTSLWRLLCYSLDCGCGDLCWFIHQVWGQALLLCSSHCSSSIPKVFIGVEVRALCRTLNFFHSHDLALYTGVLSGTGLSLLDAVRGNRKASAHTGIQYNCVSLFLLTVWGRTTFGCPQTSDHIVSIFTSYIENPFL